MRGLKFIIYDSFDVTLIRWAYYYLIEASSYLLNKNVTDLLTFLYFPIILPRSLDRFRIPSPFFPQDSLLMTTTILIYLQFLMALTIPIPLAKSTSGPALSPNPGVSTSHISYVGCNFYFGRIPKTYLVIDFCYGL
jgi:hypothetical protein